MCVFLVYVLFIWTCVHLLSFPKQSTFVSTHMLREMLFAYKIETIWHRQVCLGMYVWNVRNHFSQEYVICNFRVYIFTIIIHSFFIFVYFSFLSHLHTLNSIFVLVLSDVFHSTYPVSTSCWYNYCNKVMEISLYIAVGVTVPLSSWVHCVVLEIA